MSESLATSTGLASLIHPAGLETATKPTLPEMIHDLLRGLSELSRPKAARGLKRSIRRYQDADFRYIEVALPGLEGVQADICVHDGRIYVRMAR